MTAIKREPPPPPGPVAELFDRLDQLHLTAGRPSMRDVAHKAGLGRISSSTVHNVFRRSKVPRWIFVEEIVKVLRHLMPPEDWSRPPPQSKAKTSQCR